MSATFTYTDYLKMNASEHEQEFNDLWSYWQSIKYSQVGSNYPGMTFEKRARLRELMSQPQILETFPEQCKELTEFKMSDRIPYK